MKNGSVGSRSASWTPVTDAPSVSRRTVKIGVPLRSATASMSSTSTAQPTSRSTASTSSSTCPNGFVAASSGSSIAISSR